MAGLRVNIKGYKAIASANVALGELTVLAGVNASGKSTLARLFHHIVESNRNFEGQATLVSVLHEAVNPIRAFWELAKSVGLDGKVARDVVGVLFPGASAAMLDQSLRVVEGLADDEGFCRRVDGDLRIVEAFNRMAGTAVKDARGVVKELAERLSQARVRLEAYLRHEGDSRPFLVSRSPDDWQTPRLLQVWDGETLVFDSARLEAPLSEIYSPKRSIYIRQELGVPEPTYFVPQVFQREGRYVLRFGGGEYPLDESFEWQARASVIADGRFEPPPNQKAVAWGEWRYVRKDGATFRYADCAEGIKALAPLQVLESYGLLDSNTLLIIDEPEVHLHPQWIVACAKALVALVVENRVRVLVASHNPYLIQALQRFAAQQMKEGDFRFYLAEPSEGESFAFEYRNLGGQIGPIFKTFNVALDEIAYYDVSAGE